MIVKNRYESIDLQILKSLNNRMVLSDKDKKLYSNLKVGYEGELLFDSTIDHLQTNCLILNDLVLKSNNTTFQIDSFVIMSDTLFLFEIKNYNGDFIYEAATDKIYTKSKVEIINPLIQLKRTETLLHQLIQGLGFIIPIKASVVFVNPTFTLYQAPPDLPFIFPTQLDRLLKQLNSKYSKITEKHQMIADKLLSFHLPNSKFIDVPTYEYDKLKKGIACESCESFSVSVEGRRCVCLNCGHVEKVSSAVMRSVAEFKLLFPKEKVTTKRIWEWCKVVESRWIIRNILETSLIKVGNYRWSHYE